MPNNGWRPSRCKVCKRPATGRRPVSYRGLCQSCAEDRVTASIEQLAAGSGPMYDQWRENHARGLAEYLRRISA